MELAIFSQKIPNSALSTLYSFFKNIRESGISCHIHANLYKQCYDVLLTTGLKYQIFDKNIASHTKLLIVLGGDGSILNAVALMNQKSIPILGINLGRLGFLAQLPIQDIKLFFQHILKNNYTIKERSVLNMHTSDPEQDPMIKIALNEITIQRVHISSLMQVTVWVDEKFLNTYWADGLIIATPTGTTGYSLSCGGPILEPNLSNIVITPIAPHNLTTRPIVISDNKKLRVQTDLRTPKFKVSLDSRIYNLKNPVDVHVTKSETNLKMVDFENISFYQTIRQKLRWGEDIRNET